MHTSSVHAYYPKVQAEGTNNFVFQAICETEEFLILPSLKLKITLKKKDIILINFDNIYIFYRYDPNVELPTDVDTEQDRVLFIKSLAQFMVCFV